MLPSSGTACTAVGSKRRIHRAGIADITTTDEPRSRNLMTLPAPGLTVGGTRAWGVSKAGA